MSEERDDSRCPWCGAAEVLFNFPATTTHWVCGSNVGCSHQVQSDGCKYAARLRARVEELERFREIIGDIEQLRCQEGHGVYICCDNPEAETIELQSAVDVCGDFTGWDELRFWGPTWPEALHEAADASRSYNAGEDRHE